MSITVTEKEHWKRRIELKIDRKIEALVAETDLHFLENVKQQAQKEAAHALGIEDLLAQLSKKNTRQKEMKDEAECLGRAILATIRGVGSERITETQWSQESAIEQAIANRAKHLRPDIMKRTALGKRILMLEAEKEELLDTIWLATSPKQVKELWQQLTEMLEITPTSLQTQALVSKSLE